MVNGRGFAESDVVVVMARYRFLAMRGGVAERDIGGMKAVW